MKTRRAPRFYDDEFKSRAVDMVLDSREVNSVAKAPGHSVQLPAALEEAAIG